MGLSQREFAELLGIDVNTLQNWEQNRNKPDAAALSLVMAFDRAPNLIEQTAFEAVVLSSTTVERLALVRNAWSKARDQALVRHANDRVPA